MEWTPGEVKALLAPVFELDPEQLNVVLAVVSTHDGSVHLKTNVTDKSIRIRMLHAAVEQELAQASVIEERITESYQRHIANLQSQVDDLRAQVASQPRHDWPFGP